MDSNVAAAYGAQTKVANRKVAISAGMKNKGKDAKKFLRKDHSD